MADRLRTTGLLVLCHRSSGRITDSLGMKVSPCKTCERKLSHLNLTASISVFFRTNCVSFCRNFENNSLTTIPGVIDLPSNVTLMCAILLTLLCVPDIYKYIFSRLPSKEDQCCVNCCFSRFLSVVSNG